MYAYTDPIDYAKYIYCFILEILHNSKNDF